MPIKKKKKIVEGQTKRIVAPSISGPHDAWKFSNPDHGFPTLPCKPSSLFRACQKLNDWALAESVEMVTQYFSILLSSGRNVHTTTSRIMQNLLFFAQGYSLFFHNARLFNSELLAWPHGARCPAAYPADQDVELLDFIPDRQILPQAARNIIFSVYSKYSLYTSKELVRKIKSYEVWKKAYRSITKEMIDPEIRCTFDSEVLTPARESEEEITQMANKLEKQFANKIQINLT